jgi:hypothetical protein
MTLAASPYDFALLLYFRTTSTICSSKPLKPGHLHRRPAPPLPLPRPLRWLVVIAHTTSTPRKRLSRLSSVPRHCSSGHFCAIIISSPRRNSQLRRPWFTIGVNLRLQQSEHGRLNYLGPDRWKRLRAVCVKTNTITTKQYRILSLRTLL